MELTDTKDMEILPSPTPPLQGTAERPYRRYGLQEGASMKKGGSTGKEGKTRKNDKLNQIGLCVNLSYQAFLGNSISSFLII